MYNKGDYVVKANIGICVIDDIIVKKLTESSAKKEYYVLIPIDEVKARFFVPTMQESVSNMRPVLSKEEAWKLIKAIPDIEISWIENDKMREKVYKKAMKSNDPVELISIIKNMFLRSRERENQGKKPTSIDERYFSMAEKMLYSELAHALGVECSEMRGIIDRTIGNNCDI